MSIFENDNKKTIKLLVYSPLTCEGAHMDIIFVVPHIVRGVYGCTSINAVHTTQLIKTIGAMVARCIIVDNFD